MIHTASGLPQRASTPQATAIEVPHEHRPSAQTETPASAGDAYEGSAPSTSETWDMRGSKAAFSPVSVAFRGASDVQTENGRRSSRFQGSDDSSLHERMAPGRKGQVDEPAEETCKAGWSLGVTAVGTAVGAATAPGSLAYTV